MAKKIETEKVHIPTENGGFVVPARKRALVVPSLSVKDMVSGDCLYVKFASEPQTRAQLDSKKNPKIDPETGEPLNITSAQVIDLKTGALGELVLGYMICKALVTFDSVVGMSFELVKGKKKGRTNEWEVYEI